MSLTAGTAASAIDTQVQIQNGKNVNFNGIAATNPTAGMSGARTASIADGTGSPTVISLKTGSSVDVAQNVILSISSAIGDPETGATDLTKTGDGKLLLSGANTYTGNTTVQAGELATTAIRGPGSTELFANTKLTADSILQNTLTIGAGGSVTIRPTTTGGEISPNQAPEPRTWVLIGTALLGWLACRRGHSRWASTRPREGG